MAGVSYQRALPDTPRPAQWLSGTVATVLAMFGIYGVLAYMVVQRTREIAIRTA